MSSHGWGVVKKEQDLRSEVTTKAPGASKKTQEGIIGLIRGEDNNK